MFDDYRPDTVVLLTVDCLRSDMTPSTMPTLGLLGENHVNVTDCISVGSGTPTCMPGIMQSRLPTDDGGEPRVHKLPTQIPTLAERLNDAGTICAGWHSNVYSSADRLRTIARSLYLLESRPHASAEQQVDAAVDWLPDAAGGQDRFA